MLFIIFVYLPENLFHFTCFFIVYLYLYFCWAWHVNDILGGRDMLIISWVGVAC